MTGTSLLALLDDLGTVLDDVAVLTKTATQKTAGVLGDDLALNAQQVSGVPANRELPVVWAVAKGSLVNKSILVPAALGISAFVPMAITPLLMVGGSYLCFEGFEKVLHALFPGSLRSSPELAPEALLPSTRAPETAGSRERAKIRGAIRTDFVLSAEIITIALGEVAKSPYLTQLLTLCVVSALMTVGVYGFVAVIVKLDDFGLYLFRSSDRAESPRRRLGELLLWGAPRLMKTLTVVGTAAMFLVGGQILMHGIAPLHHAQEHLAHAFAALGKAATVVANTGIAFITGVLTGAILGAVAALIRKVSVRA